MRGVSVQALEQAIIKSTDLQAVLYKRLWLNLGCRV